MLASDDTIAAIATARGGARGIVRLSGPDSFAVLGGVLDGGFAGDEPAGRRAMLALGGGVLLPVGVMTFGAGRSYTGQRSAEILTVGQAGLLERVLGACLDAGARLASPGEFSARAYLHGNLSLAEAEGIAARIGARRDAELDAADRLRSGAFGDRCGALADRVADVLALVEAGIDFTDQEDVVAIDAETLRAELAAVDAEIVALVGADAARERPGELPSVVLVGPPNAGKSTLFNALLGRERAATGDEAGTTRDAIAEEMELAGVGGAGERVRLVDLPGLDDREAGGVGAGASAQEAARLAIETSDLLIACDPEGRFEEVRDLGHRAVLRVRTKGDLVAASGADAAVGKEAGLAVCAIDGWHLDLLKEAIADAAFAESGGAGLIPRHRRALLAALDEVRAVADGMGMGEPEMVAAGLRRALDEIGAVAGRVTPDEVIGRVFASFCVGK